MPDIVNDSNFQTKVLSDPGFVLVDFWAEWCNPCKAMMPIVNKIEKEIDSSKLKVVTINVDDNVETPAKYQVRGIPTFIIIHNGKHIDSKVGMSSYDKFKEWIESVISTHDSK